MHRAIMASLTTLALLAGIFPVRQAVGSVKRPAPFEQYGPVNPQPGLEATSQGQRPSQIRKISSYIMQMRQEVLAKLRPVERKEPIDFDEAEKFLRSETTLDKIYDDDFQKKLRSEYDSRVAPHESVATNALWRPRSWEMSRYDDGRKDLAKWAAREVVDDQLKAFLTGGDQSSAPMKVLTTVRQVTGGAEEPEEPKLSESEKAARAHRTDLPPVAEEEERIPTKLRTKVNVIKGHGALVFTNPVATTQVRGAAGEGMSVEMNRDFRKLTMRSNLRYELRDEYFNFNVNKKITDTISLDLDHYAYTGGKRGSHGEKAKEQARLNYSISF